MSNPVLAASGLTQTEASITSLVISLLVLGLLLYRQLQVRPLRTTLVLPVVFLILGIAGLTQPGKNGLETTSGIVILVALLAGDAVGLGALRALTVRIWQSGGMVMRQGTWLTMVLWVAGAAIHAVVDLLAGISDSTLLLYFGITLLAQRLVLQARAGGVAPTPPGPARYGF